MMTNRDREGYSDQSSGLLIRMGSWRSRVWIVMVYFGPGMYGGGLMTWVNERGEWVTRNVEWRELYEMNCGHKF